MVEIGDASVVDGAYTTRGRGGVVWRESHISDDTIMQWEEEIGVLGALCHRRGTEEHRQAGTHAS